MSYSEYINLKKYCYFSSLSDSALEALANKLRAVEFPAGAKIIQEGTAADAFYLVNHGELEVLKKTRYGQMAKLSVIGHGEGFGEMSLIDGKPRSATVLAEEDSSIGILKREKFLNVIKQNPRIQ